MAPQYDLTSDRHPSDLDGQRAGASSSESSARHGRSFILVHRRATRRVSSQVFEEGSLNSSLSRSLTTRRRRIYIVDQTALLRRHQGVTWQRSAQGAVGDLRRRPRRLHHQESRHHSNRVLSRLRRDKTSGSIPRKGVQSARQALLAGDVLPEAEELCGQLPKWWKACNNE